MSSFDHRTAGGPVCDRYRVKPGSHIKLADVDPDDTQHYGSKDDAASQIDILRHRIEDLQEALYAGHQQSLLVVLQALDTGGKDGTIRHVFEGVNPQGCDVWSFKVPTPEEADHDFLWRYHVKAPPKGMITIFNRSHYEEVLVVRVKQLVPEHVWKQRYDMINQFEELLTRCGTTIVKIYLHISKEEQKERLESRLQHPDKNWKFNPDDLKERARWDDYEAAYQDAINRCSTAHAPWYVVPANKKWFRNLVVAQVITDTLESMHPHYPRVEEDLEAITIPN